MADPNGEFRPFPIALSPMETFSLIAEGREARTSVDESAERVAGSQDEANDATAGDLPAPGIGPDTKQIARNRAPYPRHQARPTDRQKGRDPKGHNVGDARLELTTSAV